MKDVVIGSRIARSGSKNGNVNINRNLGNGRSNGYGPSRGSNKYGVFTFEGRDAPYTD